MSAASPHGPRRSVSASFHPRPVVPASRSAPGPGPSSPSGPTSPWRFPHVVANRGCGYRPEHTLAGFELAARLCADFLSVDLVSTQDGVLVARHEPEISRTTDVAEHPEFADRRTRHRLDGREVEGWFVDDFTLAELATLRARERLPLLRPENTAHDDRYPIPTLEEVVALRARLSAEIGWEIGLYPEISHPEHHARLGLDPGTALLSALDRAGLNRPDAPVFVPARSPEVLRRLRGHGLLAPAVLVLTTSDEGVPDRSGSPDAAVPSPADLDRIAEYAQGIGPDRDQVIGRTGTGRRGRPTSLVRDAHAAGLVVHVRTFRGERAFLPVDLRHGGDTGIDHRGAVDEIASHLVTGADAVVVDHPDLAVLARAETRRVPGPGVPGWSPAGEATVHVE